MELILKPVSFFQVAVTSMQNAPDTVVLTVLRDMREGGVTSAVAVVS